MKDQNPRGDKIVSQHQTEPRIGKISEKRYSLNVERFELEVKRDPVNKSRRGLGELKSG